MANRSFIVAVVLLVGAAILFSGFSGGTGMASKNQYCHDAFSSCMLKASSQQSSCFETNSYTPACSKNYKAAVNICQQKYYSCIRP